MTRVIAVAIDACDGCQGDPDRSITCLRCHDRGIRYRPLDRWGVMTHDDLRRVLSIIERHTTDEPSYLTDRITDAMKGGVSW